LQATNRLVFYKPSLIAKKKRFITLPQLTYFCSLFIYFFVLIKVRRYKQKIESSGENTTEPQNSILVKMKASTVANFMIAALQLLAISPSLVLSVVLNKTDPEDLGKFPFYQAVQVYTHYLGFCIIFFLVASHYKRNLKLRQAVFREILEIRNRFY
jgi:hypothetical protein